jgi:hypothetical protein
MTEKGKGKAKKPQKKVMQRLSTAWENVLSMGMV